MKKNALFHRPLDVVDKIFILLSLPVLPMILLQYFAHISSRLSSYFNEYYLFLYVLFIGEFIVRLIKSHRKRQYVQQNWIEIVIIFFPFLRVLKLFRVFELPFLILLDYVSKYIPIRHKAVVKMLVFMLVLVLFSAELILVFEKPYANSHITTYGEALWWATIGISTIGIGDVVPISTAGRIVTIVLMLAGVIMFGLLTATIAALFTEQDVRKDIKEELSTLETDLAQLENRLGSKGEREDIKIKDELAELENRVGKIEKS